MTQLNMKLQILILLATALAITCGLCEESEVFVQSGSVAVLPCVINSPDAHSTAVYWKRIIGEKQTTVWRRDRSGLAFRSGDQGPRIHCPAPNFGQGDYSLQIEKVREEDAGLYQCVVEGQSRQVMLRVLKVSFTPSKVTEGSSVVMSCSITPQLGESVIIHWELDGIQKSDNQRHTLRHVSQKDAGTWSCVFRHKQVERKASASLQVEGILLPKDDSTVVYAEFGSSVTLSCVFSDGLSVKSNSWRSFSDAKRPLPPSSTESWQGNMSLHMESVQKADEGVYQCSGDVRRANREITTVKRFIRLVIAQVVKSSTNGRTTLSCQLSNSSQVTHYEWLRWNHRENGTQTLIYVQNSTSNLVSIQKDGATVSGEWICRYYKQQAVLGNITYHLQTMSGLAGYEEPRSNKTAILIGVGFLLIILILILLQLYKNHRRRKMIMQYPAMETIVHLAANERERKERCREREKELKATCAGDLTSQCV